MDFESPQSFRYELQENSYEVFRSVLRPPLNRHEIGLRVLAKRFVDCLDLPAETTPKVVFKYLHGEAWTDEAARLEDNGEELLPADPYLCSRVCEFFAGIRPGFIEESHTPFSVNDFRTLLGALYEEFAHDLPVYGMFASQNERVLFGFSVASEKYLSRQLPLADGNVIDLFSAIHQRKLR